MQTLIQIRDIYDEFNAKFFNDELPKDIRFVTRNVARVGQAWDRRKSKGYIELLVSSRYNLTPLQLRNTVAHEMIHIWQFVNHFTDWHGSSFQRKAAQIKEIDPTVQVSVCFNSKVEGRLVNANQQEHSIVITWLQDNVWKVGRINPNNRDDYGWLFEKHQNDDIMMYEAVGGDAIMQMPKCHSRIVCYHFDEATYMKEIFPYLTEIIK